MLNQNQSLSGVQVKTARKLPEKNFGPAKGDARYWLQKGRLFKENGCPNYYCRFSSKGRRMRFSLDTANQKAAAAKAAEIYRTVSVSGWDTAEERFKPQEKTQAPSVASVGDLIRVASECSSARRHTLDAYAKAFRRIVSEMMGIQNGRKFDAFRGGTTEWREQVNAVKLDQITPSDVLVWKNQRLRAVESNALAKRSAIVTVNSLLRNAKALMGKKILPFVEQQLLIPRPLPFEGVSLEKGPSLRYSSKVDAFSILARAKEDLAGADPEGFKVLILALVCGLRRSEIDNLLWRAFDFTKRVLRVESSEYHELKSEDSAGEIDLDADTAALFQGFRARAPRELFVIQSANPPRRDMKSRFYRCNHIFERLNAWLRAQGVENIKPLHTMRKEIGSIIASEQGIFEASRYLRHSDIRITSAFYTDKKKTVTPRVFTGILSQSRLV